MAGSRPVVVAGYPRRGAYWEAMVEGNLLLAGYQRRSGGTVEGRGDHGHRELFIAEAQISCCIKGFL